MSNVSELKQLSPAAQAVKAIERGVFPGDKARNDALLFSLRNQADLALATRNAATATIMAIQAAANALEEDGIPCFTSATVTSALYRAKEQSVHAQAALDHARKMVRARFIAINEPVPPHYHENDCPCEICSPFAEVEDSTEGA